MPEQSEGNNYTIKMNIFFDILSGNPVLEHWDEKAKIIMSVIHDEYMW